MTHYFAYGSNMSRLHMRRLCPDASAVGTAALVDHKFIITRDGYASIVPQSGGIVRGVVWRLTPRDIAALNAYESLDSGLYCMTTVPVRTNRGHIAAMAYVARSRRVGRPKAGYLDMILAAARDWALPEAYVQSLARWSPSRWRGARAADSGEIG